MAAVSTFHTGKAIVQDTAIKPALARLLPFCTQGFNPPPGNQPYSIDSKDQLWARDSDKSPFSHTIGKNHTAFQSALHRPAQMFQNDFQHSDNTLNSEDCEAGRQEKCRAWFIISERNE